MISAGGSSYQDHVSPARLRMAPSTLRARRASDAPPASPATIATSRSAAARLSRSARRASSEGMSSLAAGRGRRAPPSASWPGSGARTAPGACGRWPAGPPSTRGRTRRPGSAATGRTPQTAAVTRRSRRPRRAPPPGTVAEVKTKLRRSSAARKLARSGGRRVQRIHGRALLDLAAAGVEHVGIGVGKAGVGRRASAPPWPSPRSAAATGRRSPGRRPILRGPPRSRRCAPPRGRRWRARRAGRADRRSRPRPPPWHRWSRRRRRSPRGPATVWFSVERTAERMVVAALKAGMTTDRRSLVIRASSGLEASNRTGLSTGALAPMLLATWRRCPTSASHHGCDPIFGPGCPLSSPSP